MSNALAIASVTAVLKDLLNNGLIDHDITSSVGNVTVSAIAPDRIDTTSTNQQSQLNLFLYQVTPNAGWRNAGLPSHNSQGQRISNPPLALDLHYLLTAYGALEFHSEILLGYGMQLLHETPVLTRDAIRRSLAPPTPVGGGASLPPELQVLFTSELADQVELIKITPENLNTEEISRMWTAFQSHYRPNAAYHVSVVLIESRQSTKPALPVRARNIYAVPFNQPVIEQIKSQATQGGPIVTGQPILPGQRLVISGRALRGEDTLVSVSGVEVTPATADITDNQIIVPIPATLRAGVQGVQVVHRRLMGDPPLPHRGVESNVAAFVLRPTIENINVARLAGSGTAPRSAELTLTVEPAIGDAQRVVLLLNEFIPPTSPPQPFTGVAASYSFAIPSRIPLSPPFGPPGASNTVIIPISGVRAGSYLVRIQVDGAESPLQTDGAGHYDSPQVTIP
jgi:Pvc16 N-terminal domain